MTVTIGEQDRGRKEGEQAMVRGSVGSAQSPFGPVPGSPVMSGYYGVRRAFLSDPDFHNTKQFANDACTSSAAKPFACESSAGQGHAALLDPYFPEPYGDHRPTALTPNSGTLFSASALPPLLPPPFPSDPAHFALRDSWEQTVPEGLSQPDPVPADTLQSLAPSTGSLSQLESGGAAQHRSAGWGGPLTGVQSYSLHALEDLYHTQGYPTPAPYPFTSFMTMSNDPPPKVGPFSQDEGADTSALQDTSPWTKEDGSLAWGTYECRRAY
ncbi:TPA: mCG4182-like [Bos taurus]|nr:TPA: mCG4182-like [Bos taurus]